MKQHRSANREIEIARIRKKFARATLRGDTRARDKLNKKFLALQEPEYETIIDPNERVARRILQYELGMMTYEGEPGE